MSTHTAVLLISCPDRAGIVAAVAAWVTDAGGNIVHAEQHTDPQDAMFFQRVEFTHDGSQSLDQLSSQFNTAVAQRFGMTY
jgi:formyltetrahydrofolate deformylase